MEDAHFIFGQIFKIMVGVAILALGRVLFFGKDVDEDIRRLPNEPKEHQ